jgi:hypothetical protein
MEQITPPCTKQRGKKTNQEEVCARDAFRLEFYEHIEDIREVWDGIAPVGNVLLSSRFMQFMENFSPKGLEMRYIIVYRSSNPIGIIPCSLKRFEAKDSIQQNGALRNSWFTKLTTRLRTLVVEKVAFNTLVCGNILFTGEYAFYFSEAQLTYSDQFNIVEKALMEYQYDLLSKGMTLNVSFMKDFYVENGFEAQKIDTSAFNEFKVQPNMILEFQEDWNNFEDYLASFHSKARVRARKAFQRGDVFERKNLSLEDIEAQEDELFSLYKSISEDAGFNLFELRKDYFTGLMRDLGACFTLTAYYLDGKLVAFFTSICNQGELIAHFLGYDKSLIRSHDIYLNILYDLVRIAFQNNCQVLNFGRTAMEIKSSVGALPHDMFCYIKHRKHINNLLVPALVSYLNPEEEWQIRNPFKS